MTLRTPTVI